MEMQRFRYGQAVEKKKERVVDIKDLVVEEKKTALSKKKGCVVEEKGTRCRRKKNALPKKKRCAEEKNVGSAAEKKGAVVSFQAGAAASDCTAQMNQNHTKQRICLQ